MQSQLFALVILTSLFQVKKRRQAGSRALGARAPSSHVGVRVGANAEVRKISIAMPAPRRPGRGGRGATASTTIPTYAVQSQYGGGGAGELRPLAVRRRSDPRASTGGIWMRSYRRRSRRTSREHKLTDSQRAKLRLAGKGTSSDSSIESRRVGLTSRLPGRVSGPVMRPCSASSLSRRSTRKAPSATARCSPRRSGGSPTTKKAAVSGRSRLRVVWAAPTDTSFSRWAKPTLRGAAEVAIGWAPPSVSSSRRWAPPTRIGARVPDPARFPDREVSSRTVGHAVHRMAAHAGTRSGTETFGRLGGRGQETRAAQPRPRADPRPARSRVPRPPTQAFRGGRSPPYVAPRKSLCRVCPLYSGFSITMSPSSMVSPAPATNNLRIFRPPGSVPGSSCR